MCCLLATSLFMSIMFPTIFALAIKGMGDNTKTAGSILIMSLLGGALITKSMGILSVHRGGLQVAYMVPLLCYIGVALYGWLGSKHPVSQAATPDELAPELF